MKMVNRKRKRAPRVRVPNNEKAIISINAEQYTGTLGLLSRTGGTIRLHKLIAPGTLAEIEIKTISGKFLATIQLLRTITEGVQAFRFIEMGPIARGRLEDALKKLRAQGLGVKTPNALDDFVDFARRLMAFGSTR